MNNEDRQICLRLEWRDFGSEPDNDALVAMLQTVVEAHGWRIIQHGDWDGMIDSALAERSFVARVLAKQNTQDARTGRP